MTRYYLTTHLYSDATFGRGAGVAGLVDLEIEHDTDGLPFLGGRALKGLLVEEWANMRLHLGDTADWDRAAAWLFGRSDRTHSQAAHMHVGAATLPPDLCEALRRDPSLGPSEILSALTSIRRQTSIDAGTGAAQRGSLRAMRVLLRETQLIATLDFDAPFDDRERTLGLLAACILAVRRGGTGRNRGRGRMSLLLHESLPQDYRDTTFTHQCFAAFAREVRV